MRKFVFLALVVTLALGWASPAKADPILFDPDGGGAAGSFVGTVFDWYPGNSLLIEGTGGTAIILFQANLNTIQIPGPTPDFQSGTGGNFFTAVAGFSVTITSSTVDPTTGIGTTTFAFDPTGSTNFFNIYHTSAAGDDLAGTGFTSGNLILQGTAISTGFSSSFTTTEGPDSNPLVDCTDTALYLNCGDGDPDNDLDRPLDQFNNGLAGDVTNDYPGVYSILGTGSTAIQVTVNSFNSAYFLNLVSGQTLVFSNTSQIDPYNQQEPSACFSLTGTGAVCESGVPTVGVVNGFGNRIVAQADANSSFVNPAPIVPEPATLSLLGLGLLGSAAARRRQARKAKK